MIGGILNIEDTSGPTILVGGVGIFSTVEEFGTMIITTLTVEETRGSILLVDEGQTISTIDGLCTIIVVILVVKEMGWSRLWKSLADEP